MLCILNLRQRTMLQLLHNPIFSHQFANSDQTILKEGNKGWALHHQSTSMRVWICNQVIDQKILCGFLCCWEICIFLFNFPSQVPSLSLCVRAESYGGKTDCKYSQLSHNRLSDINDSLLAENSFKPQIIICTINVELRWE